MWGSLFKGSNYLLLRVFDSRFRGADPITLDSSLVSFI